MHTQPYATTDNPLRRLFARVALQAARDIKNPRTSPRDQATARAFLASNCDIVSEAFAIPATKVKEFSNQ